MGKISEETMLKLLHIDKSFKELVLERYGSFKEYERVSKRYDENSKWTHANMNKLRERYGGK